MESKIFVGILWLAVGYWAAAMMAAVYDDDFNGERWAFTPVLMFLGPIGLPFSFLMAWESGRLWYWLRHPQWGWPWRSVKA